MLLIPCIFSLSFVSKKKEELHEYSFNFYFSYLHASGGGYSEYFIFPENLIVLISLEPIRLAAEVPSVQQVTLAMVKERKEKSKYFKSADDSKLTSSAVKKQANLRSM